MTMQVLKLQLDNAQHKSIGQPLSAICKKDGSTGFCVDYLVLMQSQSQMNFRWMTYWMFYQKYNIVYLGPGHWILAGWQVGMEGIRISSKLRK